MATIPRWGQQAQARPMPGVRYSEQAPRDAFGVDTSGVAGALDRVSSAAAGIATERFQENDKRQARDAYRQAASEAREARNNFYQRRGRNAENVSVEAQKALDDIQRKYSKSLTPAQQDLFMARWGTLYESSLSNYDRHEQAELFKADEETSVSIIEGAIDAAVGDYTSPETIRNSWSEIVLEIEERATRNGWDPQRTKEEKDRQLSTMHTKIIDRMALDDPELAKNYYAKYKDDIDGRLRGGIEETLKTKSLVKFAQDNADVLIAKYGAKGEAEALKAIHSNYSGEQETKLVSEVKSRYADMRRLEAEATDRRIDDATNAILNAGSLTDAKAIADAEPDGGKRLALRKVAEALYAPKSEAKEKVNVNNLAAKDTILQMIDVKHSDANSRNKVLMLAAKHGLTGGQTGEVLDYFRKGGAAGELKRSQLDQVVKELTEGKGLEAYPGLWDQVIDRLPPGGTITDDTLMKIAGRLLASGETPGTIYDPDMSYYDALREGKADVWLPKVTDDEEREIRGILKNAGKKINERNIRLYKKHILLGIPAPKPAAKQLRPPSAVGGR